MVLGFIAIRQTQHANDMAESANVVSKKLIDLQNAEYLPLIEISAFVGITRHQICFPLDATFNSIALHEMRTKDNEVILGYSVTLSDEPFDKKTQIFCRDYELHFKYNGKLAIREMSIKAIRFEGKEFQKEFLIVEDSLISLSIRNEFGFFLFLVSSSDFEDASSVSYQFIKSGKLILDLWMIDYTDNTYREVITITKHLVKEPEKQFNVNNVELPVSVSYSVNRNSEKVLSQERIIYK